MAARKLSDQAIQAAPAPRAASAVRAVEFSVRVRTFRFVVPTKSELPLALEELCDCDCARSTRCRERGNAGALASAEG